jgi:Spy/CpxP family protein refolding chaperone
LGIVILICGALIGAGVTAHVFWERFLHAAHSPEDAPARIVERMAGRLDLTDEQVEQIEQIVAERREALLDIRRETQPRVGAEIEGMRLEVAAVLTPEQATRWNERMESLKERWMRRGPGRLLGPPGRGSLRRGR